MRYEIRLVIVDTVAKREAGIAKVMADSLGDIQQEVELMTARIRRSLAGYAVEDGEKTEGLVS